MDSFEWNKIAGAVLFTLLVSVGLSIFSGIIFETEAPETPGYVVAVATEEGATGGQAQASKPIAVLLASADPKAGQTTAKKCGACHTFGQGEPNKIAPNLWGVVNRPIASHEGYEYDDAMKAFAENAGTWTFENLNTFLTNPKATVPGTKMAFAGLKDDAERANVIAYLRTLSDSPAPLPEAAAAEPETKVASAESGAAPAGAAPPKEAPAQTETAQQAAPAAAPAAPAGQAAPGAAGAGDPAKGATFAKRCTVCHSFDKDGPNKVGPHLFGVVDRPVASISDFSYSDAMKKFSEDGSKKWDEATLDTYLTDPRGVVPGTKMVFPGIKAETDRANVIAYLKTLAE